MRVAAAALATKRDETLCGTAAQTSAVKRETQALEPEASPAADSASAGPSTKTEEDALTKSRDDGKRRQRRTSMKKVKYVQEDDMSEEEEVLLADKKKRAQQLDYQLRAVRCRHGRVACACVLMH